jgi:hypothetical protein
LKDSPIHLRKVHSLKEKQGLWATELSRQLEGSEDLESLCLFSADSLHFQVGTQLPKIQNLYPKTPIVGWGTSYGIPQCSVLIHGEVFSNALMAMSFDNNHSVVASIQNIEPEGDAIRINRMSENLVIEIDEKPAFYRLCEHLVEVEDLPMMPPDEFRKHMGNLFLIEKTPHSHLSDRLIGGFHRSISLLGSEMTTGMVAVSESLDFSKELFLGQKKYQYLESNAAKYFEELRSRIPQPKLLFMLSSGAHWREKEASKNDLQLLEHFFPQSKIIGVSTQSEVAWGPHQNSLLVVAFS